MDIAEDWCVQTAALVEQSAALLSSSMLVLDRSYVLKHRSMVDLGRSYRILDNGTDGFPSATEMPALKLSERIEVNWYLDEAQPR